MKLRKYIVGGSRINMMPRTFSISGNAEADWSSWDVSSIRKQMVPDNTTKIE